MNKPLIAGIALFAGVAIATPMLAQTADSQQQAEHVTPIIPPMDQGASANGTAGHPGMERMGGPGATHEMAGHGWMRAMMMHRMRMMHATPQQRCEERLARHAAAVAYTVTKLNLTAEQRPLWDKLDAIAQAATQKQQQLCTTLKAGPPAGQRTVLDRVAWMEQALSAKAQALHEAGPALEQLYKTLTPEQQAIINHPFAHNR